MVDRDTSEIMLFVKSENGVDKLAKRGEVLARVYVCSSPKEEVYLIRATRLDTPKRGTEGFGSTGMK